MSEFKCLEPGCEYHIGTGGVIDTEEDFVQQEHYFQEVEEHQRMHEGLKREKTQRVAASSFLGQSRLMFSCDQCSWKAAIYFDPERREGAGLLLLMARFLNRVMLVMGEVHRWSHSSCEWRCFLGRLLAMFRVQSICFRRGSKRWLPFARAQLSIQRAYDAWNEETEKDVA